MINKLVKKLKNNKKTATLLAALVLCVGAYLITGSVTGDKSVNDDIPLHDGDVLVDNVEDDSSLVTSDQSVDEGNNDSYFEELRANLEIDRNTIISMLTDAEKTAATTEEKKKASDEKIKILEYIETEKNIETLITNKGLPECFIVISDTSVNITVNTENLDQETVTQICEIVMRQSGRNASEIVVQEAS